VFDAATELLGDREAYEAMTRVHNPYGDTDKLAKPSRQVSARDGRINERRRKTGFCLLDWTIPKLSP